MAVVARISHALTRIVGAKRGGAVMDTREMFQGVDGATAGDD
jgi:hypothetical protein